MTPCFSPAQQEAWGGSPDDNPSSWVLEVGGSDVQRHPHLQRFVADNLGYMRPCLKTYIWKVEKECLTFINKISIAYYNNFCLLISIYQVPTPSSRYQTQLRGPWLLFIWMSLNDYLNGRNVIYMKGCQTTALRLLPPLVSKILLEYKYIYLLCGSFHSIQQS